MDGPAVTIRYPTPPAPKYVAADEAVDMSQPTVRYPTPVQTMLIVDDPVDEQGRPIDYARSAGRYPMFDPRPAPPLGRQVEHVDLPDETPPAPAAGDDTSSSRTRTRVRAGNG
jgi:hypothetical protein